MWVHQKGCGWRLSLCFSRALCFSSLSLSLLHLSLPLLPLSSLPPYLPSLPFLAPLKNILRLKTILFFITKHTGVVLSAADDELFKDF
jgi:hypothetical protein